jgi:hypothetical protein
VAHQLANNSYILKELLVWDGDPLSFIFPYVIHDLTILSNQLVFLAGGPQNQNVRHLARLHCWP